jgi:hypothetical protein
MKKIVVTLTLLALAGCGSSASNAAPTAAPATTTTPPDAAAVLQTLLTKMGCPGGSQAPDAFASNAKGAEVAVCNVVVLDSAVQYDVLSFGTEAARAAWLKQSQGLSIDVLGGTWVITADNQAEADYAAHHTGGTVQPL